MGLQPELQIALAALIAAAWLAIALFATWRAGRIAARSRALVADHEGRLQLVDSAPSIPLLVDARENIALSERLRLALGLEDSPGTWEALVAALDLAPESAGALLAEGRLARTGASFCRTIIVGGARRAFRVDGGPAPPGLRDAASLLWFIDISETQAREADLRERLDKRTAALEALSRLIERAPFPMWHRGPDHRLTMVNSAYVAAVEADDAADVVARGIELIEDGGTPRAANGEEARGQDRTLPVTVAGERRMMHVVEIPLGNDGLAGYAIDVEDKEEARAELARFERAQRDLLDLLSAGVAQFGRDRSLTFFNRPFASLFALRSDFLADRPEFDRVIDAMREAGQLPEVRDFPEWKDAHRAWFTSGLVADEEDWLLTGGKHLRVVAQPLPDGGLLLIFEDRTEQIQLASARDTLLRVRSATFDNLFEAIGVFASDGRLNLWNNRFRELWGFTEEELARHPRVDTLTPQLASQLRQPRHAALVRELVRSATQERKQRSGRVAMVDGREFEFAAVPLPDGNALFTMLDITHSRMVETALRERNEALEEADRLKTAFVSNMSYELRTPLTSIAGFAEMLAGGYAGELPATAGEYVAAILDSVGRLGSLIDNVLDLTQSDMGSLLLAEDEIDLAALCREESEGSRDAAGRRSIELALDIDESVGTVTGDRRRLGQVVANLLSNALRYTEEGGRVLLHAEGDRNEARIMVSDNGRGIPPADQARVFDRFHRTVEGRPGDEAAAGLGLPIARQFVEAHGGTIALESLPGEGTTVTVTLPRTRSQQAAYPDQRAAQ